MSDPGDGSDVRLGRVHVWQSPPTVIWRGWWIPPILNPFRLIGVLLAVGVLFYPLLLIPLLGPFLWAALTIPLWLLVMIRWTVTEARQRGWQVAITDRRG